MATVRIAKRRKYTQVDNEMIDDDRLPLDSQMLMVWLLSKPDDWRIDRDLIAKAKHIGQRAVRRMFQDLVKAGYLVRKRYRNPDGTFAWDHTLYERSRIRVTRPVDQNDPVGFTRTSPLDRYPPVDEPPVDEPPVVNDPISLKTDLLKTDLLKTEKNKNKSAEPELRSVSPQTETIAPVDWADDLWLWKFLNEEQTAFKGEQLKGLLNIDFWGDLNNAIPTGIYDELCRQQFAKMGIWLRDNPVRIPTARGVRRFVSGWFERNYERERRFPVNGKTNGAAWR